MMLFGSMMGFLQVEITAADVRGTLDALARQGVEAWDIRPLDDLTARLTISRRDYKRLCSICEKRGDGLRIRRREGLYWSVRALTNRPVLVMGMLFLLLTALYVPRKVFFLRVEGNSTIPTRLILQEAQNCGITFGADRRAVRSEKVKNALVEAIPELQWAGINTEGCVAVIQVRERSPEPQNSVESRFGHIVALRDGVITDCTATRGTLLCAPGQAVAQGDILISGYTDCGLMIRAEQAEGEIYGLTRQELSVTTAPQRMIRQEKGREGKKISLLIGKKRINLWKDSGIWDSTCDRMYEEYYITLPGGFQLPLAIAVDRCTSWETGIEPIPEEEAQVLLAAFGESYLRSHMLAGKILDGQLDFLAEDGRITMAGQFICMEMIGKMQRLQIGEDNGKNH